MLSNTQFIQQSLELHLFFARIMKEHSFFLQVSFTPKNQNLIEEADRFRKGFDKLLCDVISLSNGVVSPSVLQSGEVVTPFTFNAEMASSYFTGVKIPTDLTEAEEKLMGAPIVKCDEKLENMVSRINEDAIGLVRDLVQFKKSVLMNVMKCKIFTTNYPSLVNHVLKEGNFYLEAIEKLQKREKVDLECEIYDQEIFWNDIMAEHSRFIRGMLDPTEGELINMANDFAKEFDKLMREAKQAMNQPDSISRVTDESIHKTREIINFKTEGTQGILECKIRSIIMPLLADHDLREANHYLSLLKTFKKSM